MIELSRLASTQKRVASFVIDDLVISIFFIIIYLDQLKNMTTQEQASAFILANYWVLLSLKVIYHAYLTWQGGRTIGKYFMKIRSVTVDGRAISLSSSLVRAIVRLLDEAIFYLGFLPALFSPTRQTIHDRISRSIVIDG